MVKVMSTAFFKRNEKKDACMLLWVEDIAEMLLVLLKNILLCPRFLCLFRVGKKQPFFSATLFAAFRN